ncbi:hypothetical protein WMY93_016286 [Mugilogobius chulae]|uniref:Tetratricopeptide repeat protein 32 n=1 Tax=Mugilogobius chulae TaxID=88201 RepID=A0AAW0NX70_9GOBI
MLVILLYSFLKYCDKCFYWLIFIFIQYHWKQPALLSLTHTSVLICTYLDLDFNNSKILPNISDLFSTIFTMLLYCHIFSRNCEANDLATAFNNRGQIRYFRVDFTEAVEDYTCAIRAQGEFEIPYYNRGLVHYRLGFYEEAKKDFEQTLNLNPDFEEAKVSLRQTLLDQQHKETRGY